MPDDPPFDPTDPSPWWQLRGYPAPDWNASSPNLNNDIPAWARSATLPILPGQWSAFAPDRAPTPMPQRARWPLWPPSSSLLALIGQPPPDSNSGLLMPL
jgi:hypothetical protein